MRHDVDCPYCDAPQEINHDDGYGYDVGIFHEQQCSECENNFVYTTSISFNYEAEKADCKNDGDHEWEPQPTAPKMYTKMRCKMCDEKREPTSEEKEQYDIPPITI